MLNLIPTHLLTAVEAAIAAGEAIMEVFHEKILTVELKEDTSPVTIADKRASRIILDRLKPTEIPVISEEEPIPEYEERVQWDKCWMVDPLDGTKEFIRKQTDFTVNIALIEGQLPVWGVIYAPVSKELYIGIKDAGAVKTVIEENKSITDVLKNAQSLPLPQNRQKYAIVGSKSHMNTQTRLYIEHIFNEKGRKNVELILKGSSLKFCIMAEGKADIYPRFSTIMEWDTAAGHAIAEAAGCKVTLDDGESPLLYNKPEPVNPFFIVCRK